MPTSVPQAAVSAGNILTSTLWNAAVKDNINKLLSTGHRTLTVAQFTALTGPEGTKGVVAGDEVYLEVDAANGILWHLVYESGEATYKWRCIGGRPLLSEVTATEGTASLTYAALTTPGPSVALPRAGDYDVEIYAHIFLDTTGSTGYMSYDIGGTGAVDADSIQPGKSGSAQITWPTSRLRRKTGLATSTLTAKYKQSLAVSGTFSFRVMRVDPVRIRHDA